VTGDRRTNEHLLLDGLVAVVTGAASGIGAACVRALEIQGARVISVDRFDQDQTQNSDSPRIYVRCDVANETDVAKVAEIALNAGGARILVNCAGIGSTTNTIDTDQATWDRVFEVNAKGTFLMCRALLPQMLNLGNGSIVNIGSVAGLVGLPNRAAYCASKGAVIAFTRALAVDHVSQGIRANVVCPGTVDSPWVERLVQETGGSLEQLKNRQPLGRLGTTDEIAAAVAFLAGPQSSFTTGSIFTIDGGMTAA
jgi:NAD(P)-dependent dehydrogenase (short-subunit alcohol dehydrogenase family)